VPALLQCEYKPVEYVSKVSLTFNFQNKATAWIM